MDITTAAYTAGAILVLLFLMFLLKRKGKSRITTVIQRSLGTAHHDHIETIQKQKDKAFDELPPLETPNTDERRAMFVRLRARGLASKANRQRADPLSTDSESSR